MAEHTGTLLACGSAIYFFFVLLVTFVDEQWRTWCTMMAMYAFIWIANRHKLPGSADIVRAMRDGSPLLTHTMPWSTIVVSPGLSTILFTTLRVVRLRDY